LADDLVSLYSGKFIVLDGGDGCGKSTQAGLLGDWIKTTGVDVCTFRDPGTTVIGEKIREILLDTAHEKMRVNTEVLLYMAARAQLWAEDIAPALTAGKCVIMDRWISSTCAYQGLAGGFGVENVIALGNDCLERVWPDLTVVLDVDLSVSASRLDRELDRIELKGEIYHQKVRQGYLSLGAYGDNIIVVDAGRTIDEVEADVKSTVSKFFGKAN
jgi:dTMP kinase